MLSAVLLLTVAVLLFTAYSLQLQNKALVQESSALKASSEALASSQASVIASLELEVSRLNSSLASLRGELESASKSNHYLKSEVEDTISRLEAYRLELNRSLEWFKANAALSSSVPEQKIKDSLRHECVKVEGDHCTLLLGCYHLVNSAYYDLKYRSDISTSSKSDKIQSLSEFLDNRGGDCEDYSLFYKAEHSYLLSLCKGKDVSLEAWVPGEGKAWVNFDESWYMPNSETVLLPDGFIHPNVVCGEIFDFNTGKVGGHCMIALTRKEILSTKDLGLLRGAPLVEPQSGKYMGLIGADSGIILLESTADYKEPSYIYMVVTDNDLFLYSLGDGWLSQSSLEHELYSRQLELVIAKR